MRRLLRSWLLASAVGVGLAAEQRPGDVLHSVYRATLPCADCSSHMIELVLYTREPHDFVDATYVLKETFVFVTLPSGERGADRVVESSGVWTVERGTPANPQAIVYQLHPDNPPAETRSFQRESDEELREMRMGAGDDVSVHLSFRRMPTDAQARAGGFVSARIEAPDVIAAADFARQAQTARTGETVVLTRIVRAKQEIVSGLSFRLCLDVSIDGLQVRVVADVYRDLNGHLVLSEWSVGACQ